MSKSTNTLSAGRPSARSSKAATLASLADTPAMKRVNFQLPAEDHTKLKMYAVRQGKTITELLSEYIAQLPE
ncbi:MULTISPECIES: plasmid partition protein ParG [Pseudomonadota]|jgi:hypothetical protein|uniref:Chromosome partitioning protein ParB n=1 Tax=Pseudomonas fluorescens TaxID=294 RepID=A0A4Y9T6D2_PSEFL|nr:MULTISPECIES: plasmid partition protein ParG [Pseudomonadota]AAD19679.1 hypothetical protein [Shuttle vector pME6010]AAD19686.1 hypothetical protein [Shuttle vector pME6031]AAD19691.1 hypothetical protein [Shuttle vector pME6041]AAD21656.1 hypothetical protein [Shuttle vector pME6011]AAD21663.1 hypothetical protein [Shuttle vector pME6012]AAD21671.1 hypothetical protein [Shuttle vector pME6030]AAD21674.1 hypothetical protein [Shuttle vector pME6040]ABG33934.1 ParG [Shuttle vector pME6032